MVSAVSKTMGYGHGFVQNKPITEGSHTPSFELKIPRLELIRDDQKIWLSGMAMAMTL